MAELRQFVLLSQAPQTEDGLPPLATRGQLQALLAPLNTALDRPGSDTFHGPGVELAMMSGEDPVRQVLLSVNDEEIAWPVIPRIAVALKCKVRDLETGRELMLAARR